MQFVLLLVAYERLPTECLGVCIFVFTSTLPPSVIDSIDRHVVHGRIKVNGKNLSALTDPSVLREGCRNSVNFTPPPVKIPVI